jgi:very-short-patch-repair endonuclease
MKKSTPETILLKNALERHGIHAIPEYWDHHKHIDLTILPARLDIEVDGPKHLTNAEQIIRDIAREHFSDVKGFATIHVPNELIVKNVDKIAAAIASAAIFRQIKFRTTKI